MSAEHKNWGIGPFCGRLWRYAEVESTNECALRELAAGAARHLDVHVAAQQRAGRGRRGRIWDSPAGEGLYLSLLWRPERSSAKPNSPTQMTMAGGLAALDCVRELGVHAARLKWPNDLVVALETDAEAERVGHPAQPALPGAAHGLSTWERAAKLAGVLIEARSDCAGSVVGIGLNVLQRQFPSELTQERPVTSLSLLGIGTQMRDVERELLHQLASRLQQTLEDPRGVARDFLRATQLLDVPVEVEVAGVTHRGVLEEIDEHGYLHLATSGERISLQLAHVGRLLPLL